MARILVLEDDKLFNETLQDVLECEGYEVDSTLHPQNALELCYKHRYDLYLLDINLPYENGFEFLTNLRDSGDKTPAIFITSRDDKSSVQQGFLSGCDDYMKKPIDLDELLLRIQAILKREMKQDILQVDNYMIDCDSKLIYKDNKLLDISPKAVSILLLLISNQHKVVTTQDIEQSIWSSDKTLSSGTLRVYISTLKKYFDKHISNVRGVGYRWVE
jgi:DNA-binding response OmpR family regulator